MKGWKRRGPALLLAICLLLTGCAGSGAGERELRIGLALYDEEDTFIQSVAAAVQDRQTEARQSGQKVSLTISDGERNQATQYTQVEKFLSLGYDVLCMNPVDRTAASTIIDEAERAGIPVVFFNREPVAQDLMQWDRVCYVGSDARQSAELQAGIVEQFWESDRASIDRNGDGVIQYIMLEGERRHQDAVIRTEVSVQTLRESGIELERLDGGVANWDRTQAAAMMTEYFEAYGDEIELVICNNDDMALGAVDAAQRLGLSFRNIVGIDGTASGLEAVEAGEMLGTVAMDAEAHGEMVFRLAVELAAGKTVDEIDEVGEDHCVRIPMEAVIWNPS